MAIITPSIDDVAIHLRVLNPQWLNSGIVMVPPAIPIKLEIKPTKLPPVVSAGFETTGSWAFSTRSASFFLVSNPYMV